MLQSILRLPEYRDYCDKQGHAESETEMSDLEVNEPQLFDVSKKTTRTKAKKYKGRVLTREAQPTFKVKKVKLRVQQPAGVPHIPSRIADQEQQEDDCLQVPAGQTSFHPRVFQGTPRRPSIISAGPDSSSPSELVQRINRKVSMFQVNVPERGYVITPSQNPKRRVIFEEPQYTDNCEYPMVNRTYELVRKNPVAPMWSELHLGDDQQLPMCTGEPMEPSGSEMAEGLNYLQDLDSLFDDMDVEMRMNEDNTGK